jgi:hypothetical protein
MRRRSWAGLTPAVWMLGLSGCAMVNDKALHLVSTKLPAVAIVNAQVLQGDVILLPDRTGTVTLYAGAGTIKNCAGQVRYEASNSGAIDLRCNDGSATVMRYSLLSETRGYAYGASSAGPGSLTFGLAAVDVAAYLTVPSGKKLALNASGTFELE